MNFLFALFIGAVVPVHIYTGVELMLAATHGGGLVPLSMGSVYLLIHIATTFFMAPLVMGDVDVEGRLSGFIVIIAMIAAISWIVFFAIGVASTLLLAVAFFGFTSISGFVFFACQFFLLAALCSN